MLGEGYLLQDQAGTSWVLLVTGYISTAFLELALNKGSGQYDMKMWWRYGEESRPAGQPDTVWKANGLCLQSKEVPINNVQPRL